MDERQRLKELAFTDVQKFWTEMLVVFTKFRDREQEEFSDGQTNSLGFAIRAVVTSKDSPPIPESEFTIKSRGIAYGARLLGHAVLRDRRKLVFLVRDARATSHLERPFLDYASVAGDNLPCKWRHEIEFYSNPESRWLCALFLSETRTEDHTWERPLLTSLEEVEKFFAEPEKPTVATFANGKLKIGDETLAFEGQESYVLQALVELKAATKVELENKSGVPDAVTVLKRIIRKYPQKLKDYITLPGGRGRGGYRTTINAVH